MKAKKLTKKQQAINLHNQGKTAAEIKEIVYPDQSPATQAMSLSRALKDNHVQIWVADSFDKAKKKITLSDLIDKWVSQLEATKPLYFKGEYIDNVPDTAAQQKAQIELAKLMQAYSPAPGDPNPAPTKDGPNPDGTGVVIDTNAKAAMLAAIKKGDIKTIERIVFKDGPELPPEPKS